MKISRSLRRTWWPLATAAFHAIALAVALAVFVFLISAEGFHGSWHESNLLKPTAAVLEMDFPGYQVTITTLFGWCRLVAGALALTSLISLLFACVFLSPATDQSEQRG